MLAELGKRWGKEVLNGVAGIVTPYTNLARHRKLTAKQFDESEHGRCLSPPSSRR